MVLPVVSPNVLSFFFSDCILLLVCWHFFCLKSCCSGCVWGFPDCLPDPAVISASFKTTAVKELCTLVGKGMGELPETKGSISGFRWAWGQLPDLPGLAAELILCSWWFLSLLGLGPSSRGHIS